MAEGRRQIMWALGQPTAGSRARRIQLLLAASTLLATTACGASGPVGAGVLAEVDVVDASCEGLRDPDLLVYQFDADSTWVKAPVGAVVSLETARLSEPQDLVIVDALGVVAEEVLVAGTAVSVDALEDDWVVSIPIQIREDRFEAMDVAASLGGPVYLKVFPLYEDRAGANVLVWVDPGGKVHFLGGCAPRLWTEPFVLFAETIGWEGTGEELLLALIARGPEVQELNTWTFGPEPVEWVDRSPESRSLFDDDVPQEVFSELEPGLLRVSVPDSWLETNTLLCSFIPDVGWNPCIPMTEWSQLGSPVEIDAYHVAGESIEVWVKDADDESNRSMIGRVTFEMGENVVNLTLRDPAPSTIRDPDGGLLQPGQQPWITTDP